MLSSEILQAATKTHCLTTFALSLQYFEDLAMAKTAYTKVLKTLQNESEHSIAKQNLKALVLCYRGLAKIEFKQENWQILFFLMK